jgi:hypothetical protein
VRAFSYLNLMPRRWCACRTTFSCGAGAADRCETSSQTHTGADSPSSAASNFRPHQRRINAQRLPELVAPPAARRGAGLICGRAART